MIYRISQNDFLNKNGGLIKASEVQIASINANIINQTFAQTNKILELGLSDSLNGMTPKLMIKVKLSIL